MSDKVSVDPDLEKRFTYHPPKDLDTTEKYENIRGLAKEFAYFIKENVPAGREQALALTHLEETVMWSNAGIARAGE